MRKNICGTSLTLTLLLISQGGNLQQLGQKTRTGQATVTLNIVSYFIIKIK